MRLEPKGPLHLWALLVLRSWVLSDKWGERQSAAMLFLRSSQVRSIGQNPYSPLPNG